MDKAGLLDDRECWLNEIQRRDRLQVAVEEGIGHSLPLDPVATLLLKLRDAAQIVSRAVCRKAFLCLDGMPVAVVVVDHAAKNELVRLGQER